MAQLLQLSEDFAYGEACITMNGRMEALVENYKGILEYTPEKILVQTKHGCVEFAGKEMQISYYNAEEMKIQGHIGSVCFQP